jgi:hypothetical protein
MHVDIPKLDIYEQFTDGHEDMLDTYIAIFVSVV